MALSEPISSKTFANTGSRDKASGCIEEFARRTRERVLAEGRAPSIVVDGQVDDDMVVNRPTRCGLRERQGRRGEIKVRKPLTSGFTLVIKHNALFAALLAELKGAFDFVALVRNPLAVLASWQTVDLPVHSGRIPAGEQFDEGLQRSLQNEPDVLPRQIRILNWFFESYRAHLDSARIVRYEDLVAGGGSALFRLVGRGEAPPVPLEDRNGKLDYRGVDPQLLLAALFKDSGAWTDFYTRADCKRVADLICVQQ